MKPVLFLIHRYAGLAMCLIMAAWCLSGVVMIFVPYPALDPETRVQALPVLSFDGCCRIDKPTPDLAGIPIDTFEIEMLADRPVLRLIDGFGQIAVIDLSSGDWRTEVSPDDARRIAAGFFSMPMSDADSLRVDVVDRDQWTVSGEYGADRPLFKVSRDDTAGTRIYVSSSTGKVVQQTTRRERGWNWAGSVLHWIYFTALRQDAALWTQVVIWTSLLGAFLTVTGLWFGLLQIRLKGTGRWTPYRGLKYWHHIGGLVFGVLMLTWVASGFLSVNPWGLLEGSGAAGEVARIRAIGLTSDDALDVARRLAETGFRGPVKRVSAAPLDGHLYLLESGTGDRRRIDAPTLAPSPLTDDVLARIAALLQPAAPITSQGLIEKGDSYYFAHHDAPPFPVYRVVLGDSDATRYYLDPVNGGLLQKVDRNGRLYRWLFGAVHRWDFTGLGTGPFWQILMLVLMAGLSAISLTGVYMAYRYLFSGGKRPPAVERH
jgi:PepSY-associated TM region